MSQTDCESQLIQSAGAVRGAAPALMRIAREEDIRVIMKQAAKRGWFTPDEEVRVRSWWARYLSARAALLETIDDIRPLAAIDVGPHDEFVMRAFLIVWAAVCALVDAARLLVREISPRRVTRRKLNEADDVLRVPRKQFTAIYHSLTNPTHAWQLLSARAFANEHVDVMKSVARAHGMHDIFALIETLSPALHISQTRYAIARVRYRLHSWRRRRDSAVQQMLFMLMETFGRVIADIAAPWHDSRLPHDVRSDVVSLLEPGDVLVLRHDMALSNLFLPGYWPHAALHLGNETQRRNLGVSVEGDRARRLTDPLRVLEARKDGVCFRDLDDTLAVDAVAIIRPRLDELMKRAALSRVMEHEGKLYNFDMDFFSDDRLVCTEVVYRAYQGLGGIEFRLPRRFGRVTLSAEDVLRMATHANTFETVALYTPDITGGSLLRGNDAARELKETLSSDEAMDASG